MWKVDGHLLGIGGVMQESLKKAWVIGPVTGWGKQLLAQIEEKHRVETTRVEGWDESVSLSVPGRPALVIIENGTESKALISSIRKTGTPCYFIWFGRSFSQDDLAFAIRERVYAIWDGLSIKDVEVAKSLSRVVSVIDRDFQYVEVVRALKSILIQSNEDEMPKALASELKTAVWKIEQIGTTNEWTGQLDQGQDHHAQTIPMARSQSLAETIRAIAGLERTGMLRVASEGASEEGHLGFIQGKVVYAQVGDVKGRKAFNRIFLWDSPKYVFQRILPQDFHLEPNLDGELTALCDMAESQKLKFLNMRQEVPPGSLCVDLDPTSLESPPQLAKDTFETLVSVVEYHRVNEVLNHCTLDDVVILDSLIQLRKHRVLKIQAKHPLAQAS